MIWLTYYNDIQKIPTNGDSFATTDMERWQLPLTTMTGQTTNWGSNKPEWSPTKAFLTTTTTTNNLHHFWGSLNTKSYLPEHFGRVREDTNWKDPHFDYSHLKRLLIECCFTAYTCNSDSYFVNATSKILLIIVVWLILWDYFVYSQRGDLLKYHEWVTARSETRPSGKFTWFRTIKTVLALYQDIQARFWILQKKSSRGSFPALNNLPSNCNELSHSFTMNNNELVIITLSW